MHKSKILVSVLFLSGCGNFLEPLEVHVIPSEYRVGEVRSHLATPVVDEVVRLKPRKVHILTCLTTPPAKLMQFEVELQSRLNADVTVGFFEVCPEI